MAKRYTDTDKWKKPFIKNLPAEYKLFWLYLIDDINHAGIWEVDKEVAEIRLGIKLSLEKAQGLFKEKVVVFDSGTKWFLPDFIKFQYGSINEGQSGKSSPIHKSVLKELRKYNLLEFVPKGCLTLKDKDKDKDMDKDSEGGVGETEYSQTQRESFDRFQQLILGEAPNVAKMKEPFTIQQFVSLTEKFPNQKSLIAETLRNMHNKNGLLTKYVSAYQTCVSWMKRSFEK